MPYTYRSRAGFTLIELLTVIAIIAILTAILLPVFFTVEENSRQSTSMSNMKDIQQKMEQFKLDNHRYPDVLFGYYVPGSTMENGLSMAGVNTNIYFPGLYPAYIRDYHVFTDPNNTINENSSPQTTAPLTVNLVAPCDATKDVILNGTSTTTPTSACNAANVKGGDILTTTRRFYTMDAYDTSPQVLSGANQYDPNTYVLRYQLFWGNCITDNAASNGTHGASTDPGYCTGTQNQTDYTHQLYWKNPPSDTYVTATTHHVGNADKVLVLFDDGSVKKMRAEDFQAQYEGANAFKVYNFFANGG